MANNAKFETKPTMNMLINLIGVLLLGLFAFYIFKGKSQAKRLNEYFCNAVRVYALTNEDDAKTAILTAAKVAAKRQRRAMIRYLQSMVSDIKKMSDQDPKLKPITDNFVQSSIALVEEISSKHWTTDDIRKQKAELGKINSDYLAALDKADPKVFVQKHPELFK